MKKKIFSFIKKYPRLYKYLYGIYFYAKQSSKRDLSQFYIYYKDLNFVFSVVPKNGNSTLNLMLLKKIGIEPNTEEDYRNIHKIKRGFRVSRKKVLSLIKEGETEVFAISRNPYSRLVSCYENKIKQEDHPIKRAYFSKFHTDMSFEVFAREVCKIPDSLSDPHFRSQYSILFYKNNPLFTKIAKLEDSDPYSFPVNKLNLEKGDKKINSSQYKKPWQEYYNKEIADLVFKRYEKDFKLFNYEKM